MEEILQLRFSSNNREPIGSTHGLIITNPFIVATISIISLSFLLDNEDVVRYMLKDIHGPQVPQLERFKESFVRKAEAMQKIALVRLEDRQGGKIIVRDKSKPAHISDYFEGFLEVRRVNSPNEMSEKLVEAFKETFKKHRTLLPPDIQKSGVNRIYEVMRQGGHRF